MKIEHVARYVNGLEGAQTFFVKYLGAKANDGYHNPKTDFRSYFLCFSDGARLGFMHKPRMEAGAYGMALPGSGAQCAR